MCALLFVVVYLFHNVSFTRVGTTILVRAVNDLEVVLLCASTSFCWALLTVDLGYVLSMMSTEIRIG